MPLYAYKAIGSDGKVVRGSLQSASPDGLTVALKERGLFLMESQVEKGQSEKTIALQEPVVTPKKPIVPVAPPVPKKTGVAAPAAAVSTAKPPFIKVPLDKIAIFTTELAIMVRTAVPIVEGLASLAKQQRHPGFKIVLNDLCAHVQEGHPPSVALAHYPTLFDSIYISLLSAGETSGNMPLMLDRISDYLNFQRELKSKMNSAVLYPTLIILTSLAVVSFLVLCILPTFAGVFTELNLKLPWSTRALLATSAHLRHGWYFYIGGAGVVSFIAKRWASNPAHRFAVDSMQLKIPVIGPLIRNIVMTRVLRTLSALVSSGVAILTSLTLARESAGSAVFHEIIGRVYKQASEGKGLATALYDSPYIPEQVAHMIANAEKTGTLPEVLSKVSDFYERETDIALRNVFTVIEPLFVIVLGLVVAGIAVSILLPIFQLDQGIA